MSRTSRGATLASRRTAGLYTPSGERYPRMYVARCTEPSFMNTRMLPRSVKTGSISTGAPTLVLKLSSLLSDKPF